jgi:predicted transcriptional regulator
MITVTSISLSNGVTAMSNDGSTGEQNDDISNEGKTDPTLSQRPYDIYRCPDCGNVVLSVQGCDGLRCHGEPMEQVTSYDMDIRPPNLRQVLLDAFGLPKSGLDICLCVIGDGPLAPREIAERLDYDESTVRKYLNQLTEMGLLTQSQLNRETGGFVNVYHSVDIEKMREESLIGFYVWAGEAATLIEKANLTKEDYLDAGEDAPLDEVFWGKLATSQSGENSPGR